MWSKHMNPVITLHCTCIYFYNTSLSDHSNEESISSCLSTLVWLVSLISPAKNISSTTLYTWKIKPPHIEWSMSKISTENVHDGNLGTVYKQH